MLCGLTFNFNLTINHYDTTLMWIRRTPVEVIGLAARLLWTHNLSDSHPLIDVLLVDNFELRGFVLVAIDKGTGALTVEIEILAVHLETTQINGGICHLLCLYPLGMVVEVLLIGCIDVPAAEGNISGWRLGIQSHV